MPLPTSYRSAVLVLSVVALAGCATAKNAALTPAPGEDKLAPGAVAAKETEVAGALGLDGAIRQAQIQRQTGDLTGASRTLSQLVLVAPDDARVLGEYGKTLVALGRSDDALAFLERAIQLQPFDWSLFSAQGVAFDQKAQYQQAQASYAAALRLKPGDPTVLSNNALSHMQSGDLDGAEQLLLSAAQAGADYPRISSNLALVQSLKASRGARSVRSAQTPEAAPVAPTEQAAAPVIADTATVSTMEPVAPGMDSMSEVAAAADAHPPLRPKLEELEANPRVVMQAVPEDPDAGPVAAKKPPVTRRAAAKSAPSKTATATASAGNEQTGSDTFLRPALVEAAAR